LALLFDRGMATSQQRLSVIGLLAEASVLAGKREQLARAIRLLEDEVPAPVLTRSAETTFARLLLADEGEEALRELLSGAHHESPFFQARVRLSLGMQLRRARRIVDAREPLGAAATGFEAICAEPWASRAREELRATGTQRRGGAGSASELTSQELLIAQMAAAGLSNKEIGRRLIVSPRTVGAHLYRTFPKLGVAARGELNHALAGYDSSIAS
jgi:DNA-binding NarL/FixJ family response regulator